MSNFNQFPHVWNSRYSYRYELESVGRRAKITVPLQQRERLFSCSFCSKKFKTPQALGGHHHAHRAEREILRRNYEENKSQYLTTQTQPIEFQSDFGLSIMIDSQVKQNRGLLVQGMEPTSTNQTKPYLDQLGRQLEDPIHEDSVLTTMEPLETGESGLEMDAAELDLTLRL